jgi:hypothetical protein
VVQPCYLSWDEDTKQLLHPTLFKCMHLADITPLTHVIPSHFSHFSHHHTTHTDSDPEASRAPSTVLNRVMGASGSPQDLRHPDPGSHFPYEGSVIPNEVELPHLQAQKGHRVENSWENRQCWGSVIPSEVELPHLCQ